MYLRTFNFDLPRVRLTTVFALSFPLLFWLPKVLDKLKFTIKECF